MSWLVESHPKPQCWHDLTYTVTLSPTTPPLILLQVVNTKLENSNVVPDESQELVTRTAEQTTNTLATRGLTRTTLVIVIHLPTLAVPTDPAQALKSILKG